MEVDPWEEDEAAEFEWNGEDENWDGISDQFAKHFTAMMAKTAEEDGPADVASVSLNFVNYSQVIPSDDDNLTAVQFASHYGLINLESAWDSGLTGAQGNQDVLVAVIDTGQAPLQGNDSNPDWTAADSDMSDGEGKLRWGFDFVSIPDIDGDGDEGIDNDPTDVGPASATGFHGTHVAGTVAAPTGNGVGVQGVGRNISIMPIRVLGNCGCGAILTSHTESSTQQACRMSPAYYRDNPLTSLTSAWVAGEATRRCRTSTTLCANKELS